jgi:cysteine-rich repeat protein
LNVRRRFFLPLAAVCAALAVSCGPNEQAQTVSFVLSVGAERLSEIEFVVSYANGKFAATDGQCVVSSAAGPRAAGVSEASLLEADDFKMMTRRQRRLRSAVVLGGDVTTTSSSSTTSSTDEPPTTTLPPTTTTLPPTTTTTTMSVPTTTIVGNETCGDRVLDDGEECDDGNVMSGDGCSGNCEFEFSFSAMDDDEGELKIRITNGAGIPPGAALAFCKFQGDIQDAELGISTIDCTRSSGGTCTPTTHAVVTLSTTTTTTTTAKTTTTTLADGDTTTTSSTLVPDEFADELADEPDPVRVSRKRR